MMNIDRRTAIRALAGACAASTIPRSAAAREALEAPADAVGLLVDTTLCVGCRACVGACRDEAGLPADDRTEGLGLYDAPTDLNDRTRTIVKLARNEGDAVFVKQQCMHCVDPACVSACMLGALQKREFGVVSWDPSLCIGCRYCQIACPFNVPKFEWDSATPRIVKCDLCSGRVASGGRPACAAACPRDAIVFGDRVELLTEAHRRIAEDPERYVGHVYGELDFGGTQVLYLSGSPFEELGFAMERGRPTHEVQRALQHGLYQGFAAPAALYAVFAGILWRQRRESPDVGRADEMPPTLPEVPAPEPIRDRQPAVNEEPPVLVGVGSYDSPGEGA